VQALGGAIVKGGPFFERGRGEQGGAGAVEGEVEVAGSGAVRDKGNREGGGMGWIFAYFNVEQSRQPAQALGADAERIHFFKQLNAQCFNGVLGAAFLKLQHVNGLHEGLFGHEHGFFGRTANAEPQHTGWAPTGAHGGHGLKHPVNDGVRGVEHGEFGLIFRAAAFGGDMRLQSVTGHQAHMDDRRGIVACILPFADGLGDDGGAQFVVGEQIGAAHALVDHFFETQGGFPAQVHTDVEEDGDKARILADGAVVGGAHAGVNEDLGHSVLGRGGGLFFPGNFECADIVHGVEIGNVLEGVGDALDEVLLA